MPKLASNKFCTVYISSLFISLSVTLVQLVSL